MERADPEPDPVREFFVYDKHTDRIETLPDYAARLLEAGGKEVPTTWEDVQKEFDALTRLDTAARNGEMLDADDMKQVPYYKLSEFIEYQVTTDSFLSMNPPRDGPEEQDYLLRADLEDRHHREQNPEEYREFEEYLAKGPPVINDAGMTDEELQDVKRQQDAEYMARYENDRDR